MRNALLSVSAIGFFVCIIFGLFTSCNDFQVDSQQEKQEVSTLPETGPAPLPLKGNQSYRILPDIKGKANTDLLNEINWDALVDLLEDVQQELNTPYVSFFGMQNESKEWYAYDKTPLQFSPKAMETSTGEGQPYLFEVYDQNENLPRIALAWIPDSDLASWEMDRWIQPKRVFANTSIPNEYHKVAGKSSGSCSMVLESYYLCRFNGDYRYDCSEVTTITFENCSGSGPSSSEDDIWGDGGGSWSWPEESPYDDCSPPYYCGGGGSGPDPGGSGNPECDDPLNVLLPAGCEEPSHTYEADLLFLGDIIIDPTILNNPKARCVLNNLFTGNTLANTIVKFADDDVNLNLHIELTDLGPGTNCEVNDCVNGNLIGDGKTDMFRLQLNSNRISNRTPIEIAVTYLHEAIHAEMRRYLDREGGTSTLPGFPGDFTDDWTNYILTQYGKINSNNISAAEHHAIALNYVSLIAAGLADFDNHSLSFNYYEALAWNGLTETEAWNNLSQTERSQIGARYYNALNGKSLDCE